MKIFKLAIVLFCLSNAVNAQESGPFKFKTQKNLDATEVKSQDNTGTCWSFSTTSFLESEILRKSGKKVDLSEIFTVRKIYMEKAVRYLRYHGNASFSQGALAHDQLYVFKNYGAMPEEVYNGKNGNATHNHTALEKALKTYLDSLLSKTIIEPHWKERFETILDSYLGTCPAVFKYNNVEYNAMTFAASLGINTNDYAGFTSYNHHPFYKPFDLEIPDNYSHGQYTNLPLDQLIELVDASINQGYTVEWDGDVSEPGFLRKYGVAVLMKPGTVLGDSIPTEEIPNQETRQYAFDSHQTTDDHLMHITGIATDQKGNRYYITKNSWGKNSGIGGYVYISANYLKLQTVSIYINKAAITPVIKHFLEMP